MTDDFLYVDDHGNKVDVNEGSSGSKYAPVSPTSEAKADLLDKIRPNLIVEEIRHKLMGEELINGKWTVVKALEGMAISESGAWTISSLMLPASSQNVSLSKLKDHEIKARALNISKQAIYSMLKNWKEWNINGTDQIGHIFQIVFTNTFITLKQCQEEGIRKLLKNITSEHRTTSDMPQQQQKRKWGIFR